MNFDNLLIHCSSLGLIMTEPKEKSNREKYDELVEKFDALKPKYEKLESEINSTINKETKTYLKKQETLDNYGAKLYTLNEQINDLYAVRDVKILSDTCKSHLMDLFVESKYGRIKDIKSKYLEKGTMLEEDAFTIYSRLIKEYVEKNTVRKTNGYVTGEIDFPAGDTVIIHDTKVSWDIFTFWESLAKDITKMYYWQIQGYLWLWDLKKAKVVKMLLDTPDKLIEAEKKKLLYDFIGSDEQYEQACLELEHKMKYPDIPVEERVIEFVIERNDEDIARIAPRVLECRDFLNNINNKVGKLYEMGSESEVY